MLEGARQSLKGKLEIAMVVLRKIKGTKTKVKILKGPRHLPKFSKGTKSLLWNENSLKHKWHPYTAYWYSDSFMLSQSDCFIFFERKRKLKEIKKCKNVWHEA